MSYAVIQGTVEAGGKLTKEQLAQSIDFCTTVLAKVENNGSNTSNSDEMMKPKGGERGAAAPAAGDDACDTAIMKIVRTHRVLDLDHFKTDVINGMKPIMERGRLGLAIASTAAAASALPGGDVSPMTHHSSKPLPVVV